ncbi:MAG: DUF1553 domain-containing protein [Planctomycetes bacterium]|nr:DUF1553 domain-containing protein [Planctomycetota bacterium]
MLLHTHTWLVLGFVATGFTLAQEPDEATPRHWAFIAPVEREAPSTCTDPWVREPLDAFVLERMREHGLEPTAPADRVTLAVRVALDLTGLPPEPAQLERFLREDDEERAYARFVDALLASSAFGEHWARHWMDLARFADTRGYEKDRRRSMWPYRDLVIQRCNEDQPLDAFCVEQLAGDLLEDATDEQVIATGFHRNTMTNDEGGTDDEEFRVLAVKDRVETTFQVFLGVTMGCANCHEHKYDPISQKDYYRVFAAFDQTADADTSSDAPFVRVPNDRQRRALDDLEARIAALPPEAPEREALVKERAQFETSIPTTLVMRELHKGKRRTTHLMRGGSFLAKGAVVTPGVPRALNPDCDLEPANRLELARWITSPENPLFARVAVNRVWSRVFGRGLVATEEDFGTQGELPSHPALLDHLAFSFQLTGYSRKALLRMIVGSATYRQSAHVSERHLERDPANVWLARGSRRRLDAEELRDRALCVSSLLSRTLGGPSVMPFQPPGVWQTVYSTDRWERSPGEDAYRRGLYTFIRRTSPYPARLVFDGTSRETCTLRRIRTNTPLQALVLLNDPVYLEAAQELARLAWAADRLDERVSARIEFLVRRVLYRSPDAEELHVLVEHYRQQCAAFEEQPEAARSFAEQPRGPLPEGMPAVELAALTSVAHVLLNLDEVITRS